MGARTLEPIGPHGLTAKEQAVADHYRGHEQYAGNATQCYQLVYPNAMNTTCRTEASKLLAKPNVRQYLDAMAIQAQLKAEVTAERTLRELGRIAFLDPRRLVDADGVLKPLHKLDAATAAALTTVELETAKVSRNRPGGEEEDTIESTRVTRLRFADKNSALEKLARHFGLYADVTIGADDALGQLLGDIAAGPGLTPASMRTTPQIEAQAAVIDAEPVEEDT